MATMEQSVQQTNVWARAMVQSFQYSIQESFHTEVIQRVSSQLAVIDIQYQEIRNSAVLAAGGQQTLNQSMQEGQKKAEEMGEKAESLKDKWKAVSEPISGLFQSAGIDTGLTDIMRNADEFKMAMNNMQVKTGMQGPELEMAGQSMKNLYTSGMGEDVGDVSDSMSSVHQLTGAKGGNLEGITRAAMQLRDIYGFEITESIKTASRLQDQFGVSGSEAFDLLVQGAQAGLDQDGTMLEKLRELSEQHGELGVNGVMAMAGMKEPAEVTTANLEKLNQINFDSASSALTGLARTVNTSLGGVVGELVQTAAGAVRDFTAGLMGDGSQIQGIFGEIGMAVRSIGTFFTENWPIIQPILIGLIGLLMLYKLYLGYVALAEMAGAVAQGVMTFATGAQAAATAGGTAAQTGLNAALAACPIVWIIGLVILLVAVFFAVVAAINHFMGTSISATGLIAAAFTALGASVLNIFVIPFYNALASLVNFVYNAFTGNLTGAIKVAFLDMVQIVLGSVTSIAKGIEDLLNNIPGVEVDLTSGLESIKGKVEAAAAKVKSETEWKEIVKQKDFIDIGDAAKSAYEGGANFEGSVKDLFSGWDDFELPPSGGDLGPPSGAMEDVQNNTADTAGNTAAMANSMDIMDEELKYMRDAAEQEIINRFTLAELKVDVKNNNTLRTKTDFDDVANKLGDLSREILSAAAEGGHL